MWFKDRLTQYKYICIYLNVFQKRKLQLTNYQITFIEVQNIPRKPNKLNIRRTITKQADHTKDHYHTRKGKFKIESDKVSHLLISDKGILWKIFRP